MSFPQHNPRVRWRPDIRRQRLNSERSETGVLFSADGLRVKGSSGASQERVRHSHMVSEHRTVTPHALRSGRKQLHQPVARVGEHCGHQQTHVMETLLPGLGPVRSCDRLTHISRLQPQAEGAAVVLASLDGKNTDGWRTVSDHQPTQHLHSLQQHNTM